MKKTIIIGGGFYGLYISEFLAKNNHEVILFEERSDFMQRASLNNQARVHNGYHYPRSTLTALRSRMSYPIFKNEFKEAIYDEFTKYYMIGQPLGKISNYQFEQFCRRIKAPLKVVDNQIQSLVNRQYISAIYEAEEIAFDAVVLKQVMISRALEAGVKLRENTQVSKVESHHSGELVVITADGESHSANQVFNCTYSNINVINKKSNIDLIPLRHELTEMCLVKLPEEINHLSFTIMCGPFFSIMPFPSTPYSTLSHVRYTPHFDWTDADNTTLIHSNKVLNAKHSSNWQKIIQDAKRYMPVLSSCEYQSSLWETKTILPASDHDDSRPILFKPNYGIDGYHCLMGGKIDNIYDVIKLIEEYGMVV
ncbi:FAD-binding oxidoreductase [Alginatibacterium sediminis]|uniref:FAD-binding oxidoreductase n=1 Tax=Alginatibacterium sediminis TaxID=2164068 RepID=A0A420EAU9_9ALTE|nr:FAD-dependent oxidoreductase [Alginatibacterium sediminis]RKF17801.1 FAD-binding oxidoreductase [Alginatibacterium sediminis]